MEPQTITGKWQTLTQAAASLGVSYRTISRRVAANQLETKHNEQGQKLVYIPDCPDDGSRVSPDDRQVSPDGDRQPEAVTAMTTTVDNVTQLAERQMDFMLNQIHTEQTAHRKTRRIAITAWAVLVALLIAAGGISWWLSGELSSTRQLADNSERNAVEITERLIQVSDSLATTGDELDAERDKTERLISELSAAQIAAITSEAKRETAEQLHLAAEARLVDLSRRLSDLESRGVAQVDEISNALEAKETALVEPEN